MDYKIIKSKRGVERKTNRNLILLGTGILLLVAAACGFSASTANITDAYTARSENGEYQQTAVFAQEDVFYAIIEVANARRMILSPKPCGTRWKRRGWIQIT